MNNVIHDMKNCYQIPKKQNILEHGRSVLKNYLIIKNKLETKSFNENDPSWLIKYNDLIMEKLYAISTMNKYLTLHDCGKPYCIQSNEYG